MPAPEHVYGGQAVLEGVMMRGRHHWAVAVRRPDASIYLESHEIRSIARRVPWLARPGLRGVIALGQALAIGMRALTVSANQSVEEDRKLSRGEMALSLSLALLLFTGVFIVGPFLGFRAFRGAVDWGPLGNVLEGLARVGLFLAYLALIGRMREIRRVFEYHGAEHKTIAAYEHGEPLRPEVVDRYPTLHVRCGTNFLLIVMVLTILVYSSFGNRGLAWGVGLRILAIPLIAGLSYELLRLGARYRVSPLVRALMAPGLWLQKITTRPPDRDQIEVAIAAFQEVLRREAEAREAAGPGPR
ncbi:MAG TPA: DUF1385 domain-containing protein [Actinomycetota bacterium]|nr:DUF1385 domain-containing protein [Actinomycetota bacterium]